MLRSLEAANPLGGFAGGTGRAKGAEQLGSILVAIRFTNGEAGVNGQRI